MPDKAVECASPVRNGMTKNVARSHACVVRSSCLDGADLIAIGAFVHTFKNCRPKARTRWLFCAGNQKIYMDTL